MNKYDLVIDKLVNHINTKKKDNIFISLYIPCSKNNKIETVQKFKSEFLAAIHSEQKFNGLDFAKSNFTKHIEDRINALNVMYSGLAIFININTKELKKAEYILGEDSFTLVELHLEPEAEFHVGKIYELKQLIEIDSKCYKAIIIDINNNGAKIYVIDENRISLITEINLVEVSQRNKEFQGLTNIAATSGGGNGEKHIEGMVERENINLLKDTFEYIKGSNMLQNDYKLLIIFYSNFFRKFITEQTNNFVSALHNLKPIFIDKSPHSQDQIETIARKEIDKIQQAYYLNVIKTAQESFPKYADSFEKIVEAVTNRNIDVLFIKRPLSIAGYVASNFISLKPLEGAKHVTDMVPWIIKQVIESGGKIMILNETFNKKPIFAKLRF